MRLFNWLRKKDPVKPKPEPNIKNIMDGIHWNEVFGIYFYLDADGKTYFIEPQGGGGVNQKIFILSTLLHDEQVFTHKIPCGALIDPKYLMAISIRNYREIIQKNKKE